MINTNNTCKTCKYYREWSYVCDFHGLHGVRSTNVCENHEQSDEFIDKVAEDMKKDGYNPDVTPIDWYQKQTDNLDDMLENLWNDYDKEDRPMDNKKYSINILCSPKNDKCPKNTEKWLSELYYSIIEELTENGFEIEEASNDIYQPRKECRHYYDYKRSRQR